MTEPTTKKKIGFFRVEKDKMDKALALGFEPAICYLVLMRGTTKNHKITCWSAKAIEVHTSINWRKANDAIKQLIKAKLIKNISESSRPVYEVTASTLKEPIEIWFSNGLIDGLGKTPPIKKIKQTRNIDLLKLLIDLHQMQDLASDGCLPWKVFNSIYEKKVITEFGAFSFLGFTADKFMHTQLKEYPKFWDLLETLSRIKLIERFTCLVEAVEDGLPSDIIYPVSGSTDFERKADDAIEDFISKLENHVIDQKIMHVGYDKVIPIFKHLNHVELVQGLRITHRPHTANTKKWFADMHQKTNELVEMYDSYFHREIQT